MQSKIQNTIQSSDLTFIATCLLVDRNIQVVFVVEDYRGVKTFTISPLARIENLRFQYSRGEILLSPLALSNQIRQLKTWPVTKGGFSE